MDRTARVLERVRSTPPGFVRTYGDVSPGAPRFAGSVLFGTGWALADACPGPIATQLGQGIVWSLFTLAGVVVGIWVFLRRRPSAIDA